MALVAPQANAEMWKCTDQDGNTRYTNVKAEAKGCKALNLDPINTTPAPPKPQPAQQQTQQRPTNFPSVDSETQRQRDLGRRRILEQEMALEQQQLDLARKQLAAEKEVRLGSERNYARVEERLAPFQGRVRLHESNIESLRRELANIR
jgi:hypothetical protein